MSEKKETPQWIIDAQTKIFERKTERAKAKYDEYAAEAVEYLKELFDLYFKGYDFEDEEENVYNFAILNDAWKDYCQKVMVTKSKYINMQVDAFETKLPEYIASDEGKAYLDKLKEAQSAPMGVKPLEQTNDESTR